MFFLSGSNALTFCNCFVASCRPDGSILAERPSSCRWHSSHKLTFASVSGNYRGRAPPALERRKHSLLNAFNKCTDQLWLLCKEACRSKAQLRTSCPGQGHRGREAVSLPSGLWNTGFPWDSFKWCQAYPPPPCCCLMSSDAHSTVAAESSSVHGLQCRFLCPVDWALETVHLNSSLRATEKLVADCTQEVSIVFPGHESAAVPALCSHHKRL